MAAFMKVSSRLGRIFKSSPNQYSFFSTSWKCNAKQIRYDENGDNILIEAVRVPSQRVSEILKTDDSIACPICRLKLKANIKSSDVLILSQFMNSKGEMISQDITGLCNKQHRIISSLIKRAQESGLLAKKKDDPEPTTWMKHNRYFETRKDFKHMDNKRTYEDFPRPYW